jgi:spermidine/putrescine transport system substrate-binding protein
MSTPDTPATDPALLRGMTSRRLTRRDAFRISGLSAAALALAACGVKGKGAAQATTPAPDAVAKFWAGKTGKGHVDFANWPLYMDPKQPELKKFTEKTGITVTYKEVIQEMGPWFAKVQPQLAANQSIGFDLMVITDGVQFGQFVKLGYLAPLDPTKLVNFKANAATKYQHENFDPGNVYSVPWASGMTGIAYNPDKIKTPPTSFADLWNPAYKGKVGMMSDTQELANFGLLAVGANPDNSTQADWQKAADKLKAQRDAGIVRKYYDQSYIDALGSGDIWMAQAWSGDIFQKNLSDGTNFKFVIPEEGATLWTDNMTIPVTAANPVDAMSLIDFFYDPAIAGSLAEYINYITPVPGAKAVITADAAAATGDDKTTLQMLADSPLIFPTDADYEKLHYYVQFKTPAEQSTFDSIFSPIVNS